MKKINNYHLKIFSDNISKQKPKNKMASSAIIFKSNVMNIKINNISNSKEGYIFIPNNKAVNGKSFNKELQDNKKIIKKYLKFDKKKKESEKNSLEIEIKEEMSTNNLTETLQYNSDMNLNIKNLGINCSNNNFNNYINNNINKKMSSINNKNNINTIYPPTISINIKKKDKENRIKANIDVKAKLKNKKCLYINNNFIKKNNNYSNNNISISNLNCNESNDTFNKLITKESFDNKIYKKNMQNSNKEKENKKCFIKDNQKTKRKLPNLTEDSLNKAILPSKCKTHNYLYNYMNQNSNYFSNRKIFIKNNILNDNSNEYENNYIKNLINSKKKLFIKNNKDNTKDKKEYKENKDNKDKESKEIKEIKDKENKDNKDNKDNKEMSYKKNKTKIFVDKIKLKPKNVLLLNSINVEQKLFRTKSPINENTIPLNNTKYFENCLSNTQNLNEKDFDMIKINTDRGNEESKNNNNSHKNLINNIKINNYNNKYSNKTQKDKKFTETSQKYTLIKRNKQKKIDNKKINTNLIINKKKKNSENNLVNNLSNNKIIKIENSFDDKILSKNSKDKKNNKYIYFQNSNPIINKVLIFEVTNNKISNDTNNNINNSKNKYNLNQLNNINGTNTHSYKNIIHLENISNKNNTPKKNIITDIIRKNIQLNKNLELKEIKNSMDSFMNDSDFGENISTPIDHKHTFKRNINYNENKESEGIIMTKNNTNKLSELSDLKINNNLKNINQTDKEENNYELDTPSYILNTPRLTERITELKLNLFEKVKKTKYEKEIFKNVNKSKIFNNEYKEDNFTETDEIIYEESSTPSIKKASINNKPKIKSQNKFKSNYSTEKNIVNILFLDEECLNTLFEFFDKSMINSFTLLNKKYYNCFKVIIHKKIKNKILQFYEKNNIYNNKIKLSLMKLSPLSKISPLLLHKKYIDLLFEKDNKYDKEIKKDLTRTFPDNYTFKYGNINYNKLYHLLSVYSLYNQKIGYAQGINFLVAHIIILFDKEEDAFVFLDGLIQKFEFEKLLGLQNELDNKLKNIGFYLKKFCPEICNYLDSMNLGHEFFTTNWIITLFSNSMENKYLFIIWDFLIIFGWKFFIYFIVSILNIYKDNILEEEQNKLTYFMKNILRNDIFTQKFKDILNKTFELMNRVSNIN